MGSGARSAQLAGRDVINLTWVLHRAGRIWDGGSFADMGAGEKTLLTEPIKENVVLQLDQESGMLWLCLEMLLQGPEVIRVMCSVLECCCSVGGPISCANDHPNASD